MRNAHSAARARLPANRRGPLQDPDAAIRAVRTAAHPLPTERAPTTALAVLAAKGATLGPEGNAKARSGDACDRQAKLAQRCSSRHAADPGASLDASLASAIKPPVDAIARAQTSNRGAPLRTWFPTASSCLR